ncbi:tRNA (guanosine(37)-N1)-methyltransferase TrmD [Candidatus Anaplasma sp. TIGMIC]|uniref:tRNA (guanosine(37)-N1)-methyltransferase TrmD n=1 Tax=Candidatus Anaplasma sp. TIGMIC TaxID=3020713 RepID=UPI00232ECF9F|nr:tRNA (guanosine(37)-N1)-methyltransferase TrmD [Candidatus Anaplasma sp. TIGMIC]MDB1135648.1 tRNA (guanosine(37)-N1)-methyltransferase TrmD [Candidatus Anaplasma sp. TIGMIC]
MIFNVLTVIPGMFPGPLGFSNLGAARARGLWSLNVVDIRSFALDKHGSVDDKPYGGGPGMVLKADVVGNCVESVLATNPDTKLIYTSPRGVRFTQDIARQTMCFSNITLLCGRFEGVDERVVRFYNFQEISVGDFVLTGGELAAMLLIDVCVRMVPGVVGNSDSLEEESFSNGSLEYPQYTRPCSWNGLDVPPVLLSGNHAEIEKWRREASLELTKIRRPDLMKKDI